MPFIYANGMLYIKNTTGFLKLSRTPVSGAEDIKPVREYFDCYIALAQHTLPSIGRPPPSTLGSTARVLS